SGAPGRSRALCDRLLLQDRADARLDSSFPEPDRAGARTHSGQPLLGATCARAARAHDTRRCGSGVGYCPGQPRRYGISSSWILCWCRGTAQAAHPHHVGASTMIAPVVPVRRTDRIADVVARDAGLIEVFVQHSPHFAKLRSPTLRRTMGRLVTVEQAAQIAGISTEQLLCDLNAALGLERACEQDSAGGRLPESDLHHADGGAPPVPGAREVELDVREDLRCGREPFSRIMAAVAALAEGEILRLRAPFRPVPLFSVLAKRGFAH